MGHALRMRYRTKHIVEYCLLRGIVGTMTILPYRLALGLGWLMAGISFLVARGRMNVAARRIQRVFGRRFSWRQRQWIAWRAWRNICFNAVETMRIPLLTADKVKRLTAWEDIRRVAEVRPPGKGLVIAVAHMGNWEQTGIALTLLGVPLFTLARRQKNPLTDAYLNRMREHTGMEVILQDSRALVGIVHRLRSGKILAMLPDIRAKTKSVTVRFLGAETQLPVGMALFAREAGVPILPGILTRAGWSRHCWRACPPVYPDPAREKEADWQRMTQEVMNFFDQAIREHPEQYFWFNKRWVLGED